MQCGNGVPPTRVVVNGGAWTGKRRDFPRLFPKPHGSPYFARNASNSSATMLVILIAGFTAGPAVSL